MSEKVTYKTLNSVNARMDNSVDAERVYGISANVGISANHVDNIDSGEVVRMDGTEAIATFSSYGENNLSITHQGTEPEEQCQVTTAVNDFVKEVRLKAKDGSMPAYI